MSVKWNRFLTEFFLSRHHALHQPLFHSTAHEITVPFTHNSLPDPSGNTKSTPTSYWKMSSNTCSRTFDRSVKVLSQKVTCYSSTLVMPSECCYPWCSMLIAYKVCKWNLSLSLTLTGLIHDENFVHISQSLFVSLYESLSVNLLWRTGKTRSKDFNARMKYELVVALESHEMTS